MLSGTWSASWGCPVQGQELNFNDYGGGLSTQDILQLYNEQKLGFGDCIFLQYLLSHSPGPPPHSGSTAIKWTIVPVPWSIYSGLWSPDPKISVHFCIPSLWNGKEPKGTKAEMLFHTQWDAASLLYVRTGQRREE